MLTLSTTIFVLFGAALGLRFKVWILTVPIMLAVLALPPIVILGGHGPWLNLWAIVLAVTGLQLGYLAGAFARQLVESAQVLLVVPSELKG